MNCNFLSKKLITWFDENQGSKVQDFSFRFRGKESNNFLSFFPKLIEFLKEKFNDKNRVQRLLQIFYQSLQLRYVVSYSVRITEITEEDIAEMQKYGRKLFQSCALYDTSITPSLWTLSNVAPVHAKEMFSEFGLGLGANTMEGREQKHQRIAKYSENATYQCQWPYIFRHEFIQLVYLRENGFDTKNYRKRGTNYIPAVSHCQCKCSLPLFDNSCKLCDCLEMKELVNALAKYF